MMMRVDREREKHGSLEGCEEGGDHNQLVMTTVFVERVVCNTNVN